MISHQNPNPTSSPFKSLDMFPTLKQQPPSSRAVATAALLLLGLTLLDSARAQSEAEEQRFSLAKEYLCRYGYMYKNLCYFRKQKADDFLRLHAKPMREGLRLFQKYFNLTEDGQLDFLSVFVKVSGPITFKSAP